MATIKEDYVSFETAKLLKDKGFDEPCLMCYTSDKKLEHYGHYNSYKNSEVFAMTAPTLQMAMKWLREDKKILISIFCHIDKGYWFCIQLFINSPYKFATSESIHRKEEILGKIQYYDTYEQACEAAIKYCLENLIQK
jgi:hypothetical protein